MDKYYRGNYTDENFAEMIDSAAQLAHEANRAFCQSIDDYSQPVWDEAPDWQRASACNGAEFHFDYPDASADQSHRNWVEYKLADGWSYGQVKDPELKTHPCIKPFNMLPFEQRVKDHIFRSVVHGYFAVCAENYIGT
jgi:hypothetical protein